MLRSFCALMWFLALPLSALAQVQPSNQTTALVADVSEAFLDQIVKEEFADERAFMSDRFAELVTAQDWRNTRLQVIGVAGKTARYAVHGMTYYQEGTLLAAVDFSGPAEVPDTFVCGFMLWQLPRENAIGLTRFEQNVVQVDIFRSMLPQNAAQTMTNWRCPTNMIENVLGVSVQ